MEIRSITHLKPEDLQPLITGYTSPSRYVIRRSEADELTTFSLTLEPLETPYVKIYEPMDGVSSEQYTAVLARGLSLGAFDGEQLVGVALAENHAWNNSLWVWEFHIAESQRGQGIGSQLMEALAHKGREAGLRAIFCETQSTNVPAVRFYRKVGFTLDGINLSYYTNEDWPDGEVALFMKRVL